MLREQPWTFSPRRESFHFEVTTGSQFVSESFRGFVTRSSGAMGRSKFQDYLPDECYRKYSCRYCRANLANHDELISKVHVSVVCVLADVDVLVVSR